MQDERSRDPKLPVVTGFGALLLLLLYLSHRLNTGLVVAFVPFIINAAMLTVYKTDRSGTDV